MQISLVLASMAVFATACSASESSAIAEQTRSSADSLAEAARTALAQRRPWLASRLLEPALRDSAGQTPERVLLAARAAGEWGGWQHVAELLDGEAWVDSAFEGQGRELLARAALDGRNDTLALRHAVLAEAAAITSSQRAERTVLVARALDRLERRDSAAIAYARAATLLPDIADWLRLREAALIADSGGRATAYASVRTTAARLRIPWTEAQAREVHRDFAGAAREYTALGARATGLRLRLTAAKIVSDSGAIAAVRHELRALIEARKGTTEARTAAEVMDEAFAPLQPAEELAIARSAATAGPPARALAGYARVIPDSRLATAEDRFSYGTLLSRARRDREAAMHFARVRGPDALVASAAYQRARSILRDGNATAARTALRAVIKRHDRNTEAASSALFLLGDMATDDGRDSDARSAFRELVMHYPGSTLAPEAWFRAAMIAVVERNYRTAARELDSLVRRHPSGEEALAALYWAGRSLEHAGQNEAARTRWRSLIERDPLSYYALLAARRLGESPWAPAASADSFPSDSAVVGGMRRAALLAHLGMDVEARHEYDALAADAGQSTERLLATAVAFRDRGLSSRAIQLGTRALARGAPRTASLYRLLYPVTYDSVLLQEAARYRLDPALVAALIRQESNFEPRATSQPGARGLMQIMPAVGQQLARTRKLPLWDPELLYQPDLNIELGVGHLAGLLGRYAELSHALAAYNAGGTPVRRWLAKKGVSDPEMFVERIPYGETRDYVRIITRNRELYRSLYGW